MKRKMMTKAQSRKNFSRGNSVKGKNYRDAPMRGGIRL